MKISQHDKKLILTKIATTLIEAEKQKLPDPQQLLLDTYHLWYDTKVAPYKDHPLYPLITKTQRLNIKLDGVSLYAFSPHPLHTTDNINSLTQIIAVRSLQSSAITPERDLISCSLERYNESTKIVLTEFPAQYTILLNYKDALEKAVGRLTVELTRLKDTLDTLNTYKQLETRLPVIFNAMPESTKEKYQNYRNKLRNNTRTKKEEVEIDNFDTLGTTLAIESLKNSVK